MRRVTTPILMSYELTETTVIKVDGVDRFVMERGTVVIVQESA